MPSGRHGRRALAPESVGTAEAKRRFSELVDRVGEGERLLFEVPRRPPSGLAAVAGALADWGKLDEVVTEIYAASFRTRAVHDRDNDGRAALWSIPP